MFLNLLIYSEQLWIIILCVQKLRIVSFDFDGYFIPFKGSFSPDFIGPFFGLHG